MSKHTWLRFWGRTFVQTPMMNGTGRYVQQLQRITFCFCKTYGASIGMREYIQRDLINFAKANPSVAVYLKPRRHHSPKLECEYLNGEEKNYTLHNLSVADIHRYVELARGSSGLPVKLMEDDNFTYYPSIQGPWTPWVNHPPEMTMENFPNVELSEKKQVKFTGTDQLREIFKKQQQEEKMQNTESQSS